MYVRRAEHEELKALFQALQMRVDALEASLPTAEEAGAVAHTEVKPAAEDQTLDGDTVKLLKDAGFDTPAKVIAASDDDLLSIKGVGQATLKKIREVYPGG